ncbi:hypothetical protein FOZ61_006788 [Perkinsus olseni]|uniref:Maf-like protein n=1 Tax=Perkinsus olseni TaxID=32597 RepID=A0A7J6LBN9_PEROL|nr:hypothetical protein FOZ61_006788 [Perkinsus olseni]
MAALSLLRLVDTLNANRFVLASKSPRRLELLKTVTGGRLDVEVVGSTFPEDLDKSALSPAEYVLQTATEKGKEVISRLEPPPSGRFTMVLSADTVVVLDGKILEKPDDHAHAMAMLRALRGKTHEVSTGVCVVCKWADGRSMKRHFTTTTRVTFAANITDEDLQAYVDTEEPMGKAGSYGIQGIGGLLACKVDGCYSNVPVVARFPLAAPGRLNLPSAARRTNGVARGWRLASLVKLERTSACVMARTLLNAPTRSGRATRVLWLLSKSASRSSWRVNDRGDIVLRKRGTQWNLYIHELDASSSSLAVATPARVPNGTTCLVMLERVDQPGSFVACEPSEGSVWVTTDEGQLASAASKFLLRERVWSSECQDTYVISPVGHPELFLRHSNWKVRCDPAGAGAEFNGDATFRCILAPVREEPNEIEVLTKKLARLVSRRNSCKQKLVALKKQFEDAKVLVQSLKKDIAATEK